MEIPTGMFEALIERTQDAVVVMDVNGRVIYSNRASDRLRVPANIPQLEVMQIIEVVRSGGVIPSYETTWTNADGSPIHVSVSSAPITNDNHVINGIAFIVRDMSRSVCKSEQRIRKEKLAMIGKVAAGIAHQIRNPLTSVRGFAQLLQNDVSQNIHYINVMLADLDRALTVVSHCTLFAYEDVQPYHEADIQEILEEVQTLVERCSTHHAVRLCIHHERTSLSVRCVRDRLITALCNVIKNAIEASSPGGKVIIETGISTNAFLYVRCQDTGSGFTSEALEKLGEPFFTTKESGTGLGLVYALKVIEEHLGLVQVTSHENVGTIVQIEFPFVKQAT